MSRMRFSPSRSSRLVIVRAQQLALLWVTHEEVVADDGPVVECCLAYLRPVRTHPHDVFNFVTMGDEVVGDDAPVAAPPHRLGAHDRGGDFGSTRPELRERIRELPAQRMVGVIVEAAVTPVAVDLKWYAVGHVAPPGQALAFAVSDAVCGKVFGEVVVVEPRVLPGPGQFAHIHDGFHTGSSDHLGEVLELEVGVAHGENAHADNATREAVLVEFQRVAWAPSEV